MVVNMTSFRMNITIALVALVSVFTGISPAQAKEVRPVFYDMRVFSNPGDLPHGVWFIRMFTLLLRCRASSTANGRD